MLFCGGKTVKLQTQKTIGNTKQSRKIPSSYPSGYTNNAMYSHWRCHGYEIRIGESGNVYAGKKSLQQTGLCLRPDVAKRIRSCDDADLRNKIVILLIKYGYIQL